ncbi:ABC transporter permease [Embleya scabrispora]|uniref:ABC transporter permease n=1 Tax=Embleya scabrispora TaxID=159449 RepID=UPI000361B90F|nr:ABC transporter permease [Embleya scabrispora]MYS80745.1 ABC transporter permease subunit [Streptomyces sp. SID5474]
MSELGKFLIRKLFGLVATLLAASFVVFGATALAPGDPIAVLTGGRSVDPETIASLRAHYHLDDPFLSRYWQWLTGILHGDLGQSIIARRDVSDLLASRTETTVLLVVYAAVLILAAGITLGIVAALRKGAVDNVIMLGTTAGMAIPSFLTAIVLIVVFATGLGWFPVFGPGDGFTDRLWHLTLPAIALAVSSTALVARLTRAAIREELGKEHVETAISRGIPRRLVVRRHVLRNAMVPITTVSGLTVAGLVVGSLVVERAFSLNGIGAFLIDSVTKSDYPVVQAIVLLLVATFVVLNTLVDVLYRLIDSRIEPGGRG